MAARSDSKVAIVVGASRGIGYATARALLDEGASVCITARHADELEEASHGLEEFGEVLALAGRAQDPVHQQDAVAQTLDRFGRLDHIVYNVGINPVFGPLIDLSNEAAKKVVDVNALTGLSWVREACRVWMSHRGGSVVMMSSVASFRPESGLGVYGASKAMLEHLTSQLALELSPSIRVNAVAPAMVTTTFASDLFTGREKEIAAGYPMKRLGTPEDVAHAITFLLSDKASWITGQTLVIDGGCTIA